MNNFDENKEFVRRPSAQQTPPMAPQQPTRPQTRPAGGSQRPEQSVRPQARPAQGILRQTQMPSQMRSPQQKRPTRPAPAPQRERISPDGQQNKGPGAFCGKNILIYFCMLVALLIVIGAVLFSALSTTRETPKGTQRSYTVSYYKGMGEDAVAEKHPSYELGGVSYIDMTAIADICSMTVSGGHGVLRFGSGDSEYAEFCAGKSSATINGENVSMTEEAVERDPGSIWIPLEFARTMFASGVEVSVDEENATVSVKRNADEIKFAVKGATGLGPVDEDPDLGQEIDLEFKTDLTAYEKYMNPDDRDAYLILVNKTNSIDGSYIPEKLTILKDTRKDGRANQQMVETAAMALEAMFIELRAAGFSDVSVTSGYRSYSYQESLFNSYISRDKARYPDWTDEQVKNHVLTYSAFPGTSEHQTGLCCDMHNLGAADVAFAKKEAYKWLEENCWKFGFIIRFPEDKVDVTGYSYEPWHYRFVGRYHANAMRQRGMCLEEYVEYLNMTSQD
ncbi:MAG: D-alanyl-D-alanine carboxypeptidase family protein [Clostridia bacterium]|nr:D-alanyl-D-alanine carboxypeptidase family protein [Clostridia bacterium]